jgi:hypothetical protein
MFGNQTTKQPQPFGVDDQQTSNSQQAVPLPYVAGTRKVAVKAMSPVYNLNTAPAPNQVPTKK